MMCPKEFMPRKASEVEAAGKLRINVSEISKTNLWFQQIFKSDTLW